MLTTSDDEAVTVEVTLRKWTPGAVGGGGSRPWVWAGYLPDVKADAAGVYVYEVPEGQWLDVHMENKGGEEVGMLVEQQQPRADGGTARQQYPLILDDGGDAFTSRFRVGLDATEWRLRDARRGKGRAVLLHVRFVGVSAGGGGGLRSVGCLLEELHRLC